MKSICLNSAVYVLCQQAGRQECMTGQRVDIKAHHGEVMQLTRTLCTRWVSTTAHWKPFDFSRNVRDLIQTAPWCKMFAVCWMDRRTLHLFHALPLALQPTSTFIQTFEEFEEGQVISVKVRIGRWLHAGAYTAASEVSVAVLDVSVGSPPTSTMDCWPPRACPAAPQWSTDLHGQLRRSAATTVGGSVH